MMTVTTAVTVWRLQVAGEITAVRYARHAAAATLAGWGTDDRSQDVILLIGELVTNAAVHAGGLICLQIGPHGPSGDLYCEVSDTSPQLPCLREAADHDESGHGLMLLAAMAEGHGWYPTGHGKVVWFIYAQHPVGSPGPVTRPPPPLKMCKLPSSALSVLEPGKRWAGV
jgi:anti-sigma regulatory factor (Ser/Thr protein kinase)